MAITKILNIMESEGRNPAIALEECIGIYPESG